MWCPDIPTTIGGHVCDTTAVQAHLLDSQIFHANPQRAALVNPDMVASTFHLLLAASTALLYDRAKALHVKTLHAELIYALAPSCNISEAFRVFGAGKGDTKVGRICFVVCIVCCCVPREVKPLVEG